MLTSQHVDSPLMRRAQIPESMVRRCRRHMIETGQVTIEDLTEMAAQAPR